MATYQLPDGRTVSDSMSFTLNEIQYPSNWLLLSTPEDREALEITGPLPEPAWYDQQFYCGYDDNGQLIPKDHALLVTQYSEYVRMNANAKLRESDWLVIREQDNGTPVPQEWRDWRESIRLATGTKVAALEATTSTEELAAYVTGSDYNVWPHDPNTAVVEPDGDGLESAGDGSTADAGLS